MNASPVLQHHSTLYLPDGDLVIFPAPSSDDVVQVFRVHRGILSYNSPVFAGMLTLPRSPPVNETYDGAPLVRLVDDAEDLASTLQTLYNPSALSFRRLDPDIPLKVRGILRLAKKYQMDSVRARIVHILSDSWPITFADWLRHQSEMRAASIAHLASPTRQIDGLFLDDRFPEPAGAVRLAIDYASTTCYTCPPPCSPADPDVRAILPAAYYALARTPSDHDWIAARASLSGRCALMDPTYRTARWALLDRDDLWRVVRAREELVYYLGDIEEVFMTPGKLCELAQSEGCLGRGGGKVDTCASAFAEVPATISNTGTFGWGSTSSPDPLGVLESLGEAVPEWGLCVQCREAVKGYVRQMQQDIWRDLPDTFGL